MNRRSFFKRAGAAIGMAVCAVYAPAVLRTAAKPTLKMETRVWVGGDLPNPGSSKWSDPSNWSEWRTPTVTPMPADPRGLEAVIVQRRGKHDWSNPDNWAGGQVPRNGDSVLIKSGSSMPVVTEDIDLDTLIVEPSASIMLHGCGVQLTAKQSISRMPA